MAEEIRSLILYYGREGYYQTMQNFALEGAKKYPNDLTFKLFGGYSLVLCGQYQAAIRELDSLQNIRDFSIGSILALVAAHRSCQSVDKDAVKALDEKLKTERVGASGSGLYHAAVFLFLQGKIDKSREYLDKSIKQQADNVDSLVLKAWIDMKSDKSSKYKAALSNFKIALERDKKNIDAALGLAKLKEAEQNFPDALAHLNQLIVKFSHVAAPLIEKMKIQLCLMDWEQSLDTANRLLSVDGSCIDALKMKSLIIICRHGNFDEGAISLRRLISEVEKNEAKNPLLLLDIARIFSSVACRNTKILQETHRVAEKSAQLLPSNAEIIAELGFQNLKLGKVKEAMRHFKNVSKIDDSSVIGLMGLTSCQLHDTGVTEQIKQQVDFLKEIESENPSPELLLMSAKLCVTAEEASKELQRAAEKQLRKASKYSFGISFIYNLNVDFLLQITKENLEWAAKTSNFSKTLLKNCISILQNIIEACPGLVEPHFELARVHFRLGNLKESKELLSHILDDLDASLSDGHVLMAQIHLQNKNYSLAARTLEVALSYNFQIREHPLYHLISAMVHKQENDMNSAIKCLTTAMASPAYKMPTNTKEADCVLTLSLADKAVICLELVEAYNACHKIDEADKLLNETLTQFTGTSEEGRVRIANSNILVSRGNINAALESLQKIEPEESYFFEAREILANIFLKHRRNRDAYIQCYMELVKMSPSQESYELLGDAYTSIQEPDLAIEVYEEALKKDPKNCRLICKVGKVLVKTHHFSKAINYYKEAVKNDDNPELLYDMAELYFKLGQMDNAERILVKHVKERKMETYDPLQVTLGTKILQLLAKVRDKSGSLTDSLAALKDAKEGLEKLNKRTPSDEYKTILVNICIDTALLLTRLRDYNGAVKVFRDALTYRPSDPKVLVGLARLYMQMNNIEECQSTCQHLLATDPDNEPATVMLADIAFRKVEFESSAHYFKQLLTRSPYLWTALARLIEVMRRIGKLDEAKPFITQAESHKLRATHEAGLHFCKGLYDWYSGDPQNALINFNRARNDNEWGQQAVYNMIEVCLNPDNETLGGEAFSHDVDDNEIPDTQENALKTAQRLLLELKPRKNSEEALTHRLLENFWLLATRQRTNIEKALQDLIQIASDDYYKDHVGVGLAISTAYMLQKQSQKARNHLKRMVKTQWKFEDAEYLERSWLLLTDIYIQGNKTELATDLIQRVLEHNKSCYKAYEYAGYIAEKEQLYKEAAFQYESAWKYNGKSNPAIGYKLAFNYMKGKSYADAIDVCHAVLKLNPSYPRIRKEILEKSRNNLRT